MIYPFLKWLWPIKKQNLLLVICYSLLGNTFTLFYVVLLNKIFFFFFFFFSSAGADVDIPDKEDQTALHICVQNAIVHSSYAAVERLLAAGASVNA